jgi:hypothetical protein
MFTELEGKVFDACLNYTDREGQLSDNYSNYDESIAESLDITRQALGGVVSSLIKKGYAVYDDEGVNGTACNMVWLTEHGVNTWFDLVETGGKAADIW